MRNGTARLRPWSKGQYCMKLPADHPQRIELNNEVHARPPEPLVAPVRLSYLALLCDGEQREAGSAVVRDLCARYGVEPPADNVLHFNANLGPFRLKWERHTDLSASCSSSMARWRIRSPSRRSRRCRRTGWIRCPVGSLSPRMSPCCVPNRGR